MHQKAFRHDTGAAWPRQVVMACLGLGACALVAGDAAAPPAAAPAFKVASTPGSPQTTPVALQEPAVLEGTFRVWGPFRLTLAYPAVRFPDKVPNNRALPRTNDDVAQVARLEKALGAAIWRFAVDGSVRVSWSDPFMQRAIEMTGSWRVLFDAFVVEVKNPEIRIVRDDGSPNAPLALECSTSQRQGGEVLSMSACQFFYALPDGQRFVGQPRFELRK